jgi:hypothetical protein
MWIAWRLPRPLVMWAAYRVGAHATQGQYGSTEVPKLTFMDAMARWPHPGETVIETMPQTSPQETKDRWLD